MKIVLWVLGTVIALAIVAFFVVAFSLGSIVKGGVNHWGPQMTQTKVELGGARISPFSGHGTLSDLVVGNPPGWQSATAFTLHEISIDVVPSSLVSDHVVVKSLVIDQPEITYETKITTSNLQELVKAIQQSGGSSGNEGPQARTKEGKPIKIEVKSFILKNGKITVIAGANTAKLDMPTLELQDLGTREGGLTPAQLTTAVAKAITAQVVQAGARKAIEKGVLDKAQDSLLKILGGNKNAPATPSTSP